MLVPKHNQKIEKGRALGVFSWKYFQFFVTDNTVCKEVFCPISNKIHASIVQE